MSILIKGMTMPPSCNKCRFFVDAWCYALDFDDWRNAYNKPPDGERLAGCPLIELPPHGRLIDADALTQRYFQFPPVTFALSYAPTIIEAEETNK